MAKSLKFIAAFLCLSVFFGCKKFQKPIEFDIPYTTEFTITTGGLTVDQPIDFQTPEIETAIGSKLKEFKTEVQFIEEIRYVKFDISVKSPVGQKVDFLKAIDLYLNAEGLSEKLVASKNPVPEGDSTIVMDLPDTNIKSYISKDKFRLRALIVPDATLSQSVTLIVSQTVRVKAKQLFK